MEKIVEYLEQLDLSEVEAKLYISLLENGPTNVRDLSTSIGLKRTTAYTYIDQLIEKGLVTEISKGFHKQIAATQPDHIQYLIEKKLESAITLQKTFPDILKTIGSIQPQPNKTEEADIKYFKGRNGVRTIYEDALSAKELRTYANLAEMVGIFPDNINLFANAFKKNKKIKIYELVEDSPAARQEIKLYSHSARYFYKFIPSDVQIHSTNILIYEGKVGIINTRDAVSGVILHNVDYFNISKSLFDYMWSLVPSEI